MFYATKVSSSLRVLEGDDVALRKIEQGYRQALRVAARVDCSWRCARGRRQMGLLFESENCKRCRTGIIKVLERMLRQMVREDKTRGQGHSVNTKRFIVLEKHVHGLLWSFTIVRTRITAA